MSKTTSVSASTNSALVSTGVVAASSVSASAHANKTSTKTSTKTSKGDAAGLVANPVSWKYGVAILISTIGSYILGSEF
ncbi:Ncw1p PWA37_004134 [Arxiozyma heterogenica]|uniref:Uncharacterized protein n=1 Tax=Arxiozyma heterogenica TaxID=278026 RepID=A0AAN7WM25_9SACH|nr:hypothetical protein RI543_003156 [Kazachstania heterogenica]